MPKLREKKNHRFGWDKLSLSDKVAVASAIIPHRGSVFESEADLQEAWKVNRERLLTEHIAAKPGTRPRAWWLFDAPEGRRKIGTQPMYATGAQSRFYHAPSDSVQDCVPGQQIGEEPVYESEREYLDRHDLLTEAEK